MALTKAQRKARARIGKGVIPQPREPNGRLSRRKQDTEQRQAMTEAQAKAVAIAARMRRTGLSAEQCDTLPETGKPNAGTQHGILCLQGYITLDQWRAAEWFLHARNDYLKAIDETSAIRQGSPGEFDQEKHKRWCEMVKAKWEGVFMCLREASIATRSPIMSAFDHILQRQAEGLDHMYGDLRIGLNAISRVFLECRRQAA